MTENDDDLPAAVIRLAGCYNLPAEEVHEVPGGVANRAFALGPQLFARVARNGYEADLDKETMIIPAARSVGVRTPAILEYDNTCTIVPAPYVVMERVHGVEPAAAPVEIATDLARLHAIFQAPPDAPPLAGVPADDWGSPGHTVQALAIDGHLDQATADWLSGWIVRLDSRFDRSAPKVLIHGDVAPHNLLVDPGTGALQALIDWGDAAWTPRAQDFAKLRLSEVAAILPHYLAATRQPLNADELAAGILHFHLSWSLSKLTARPWQGQRHWTAPPLSRFAGLLQFFTTNPPAPWSTLT
ncbi:phosphotransferase family protein [Kribbella antibiotica]|uniref:phosphotransferase family protein n=1 Tax=Kribbella antibiotica TaxID=190195 RepID=UPI0014051017|nr:aminoglycoside phosphotransferase family protein [Kribbella antibiotica]